MDYNFIELRHFENGNKAILFITTIFVFILKKCLKININMFLPV